MKTTRSTFRWALSAAALALFAAGACTGNQNVSFGGSGGSGSGAGGAQGSSGSEKGSSGSNNGSSSSGVNLTASSSGSTGSGGSCPGATTCAKQKATCGAIGDGCGGILQCGSCSMGQICGAQIANQCGSPKMCTPKSCGDYGYDCGQWGDGCGNAIDCGQCMAPESCSGGGKTGVCGQSMGCTPKTCAQQGADCGPVGDGCGGLLQCGSCQNGQSCGGGGKPSVCGKPPCVAATCQSLGVDCGPVADGCGGLLQCGGCSLPEVCGGGPKANVCAIPASCVNLCLQQVSCKNGTTTASGRVFAPGHVGDPAFPMAGSADPLPNVLVYVPNAPVQPFKPGVNCDNCGASVTGSPLVKAVSAYDGSFTLKNMPVGKNIPLVIQIGRWRRQVVIPQVVACQDNALSADLTRLPRNQGEGDIPLMAFATGAVDSMECVLRKIGVDDAEFTNPTQNGGTGRIQFYYGDGAAGAVIDANTPAESTLVGSTANLNQYDVVYFPCQGSDFAPNGQDQTSANQQNLIKYTNAGGRVFATHFSYVWLYNDAPFSGTANWKVNQGFYNSATGIIDQSFPKGKELAQWLQFIGASGMTGVIPVNVVRQDYNNVVNPSQNWVSAQNPNIPSIHYTFNTPVGAMPQNQCGRVVYSDFHVEDNGSSGLAFPSECPAGAMTPQEKLLEFMIFDLTSCVSPDQPSCTPKTCVQQNVQCGPAGDGCGNVIQCGTCQNNDVCQGVPSQCVPPPSCTPLTCVQQNIQCGPAGDGCGNVLQCGTCQNNQQCGGGGPGICGNNMCTPKTCGQQGIQCGPAGDGCGNLIQCGSCAMGQQCGGPNQPGVCVPVCTPKTCQQLNANCGAVADGCGNILQCGTCQLPQTCGGGGVANQCGGGVPQ